MKEGGMMILDYPKVYIEDKLVGMVAIKTGF